VASIFVCLFILLFVGVELELRAYTLSHSTSPVLGWVFSRQGFMNYLPGAGFEQ
jgi:hypothetical protein